MNGRELTDAECDALAEAVTAAGLQGSCWGDAEWDRALIRAGCRAVLAAGVPREPTTEMVDAVRRYYGTGSEMIDLAPELWVVMHDAAPREPVPEPVAWLTVGNNSDGDACKSLGFTREDAERHMPKTSVTTPLYTREGGGT
jgi:hypothetical protein